MCFAQRLLKKLDDRGMRFRTPGAKARREHKGSRRLQDRVIGDSVRPVVVIR